MSQVRPDVVFLRIETALSAVGRQFSAGHVLELEWLARHGIEHRDVGARAA